MSVAQATGLRVRRPSVFDVLVALVVVLMVALIVYPLARVLGTTFWHDGGLRFSAFRRLGDDRVRGAIWETGIIAAVSTVLGVGFAGFMAWVNERTDAGLGFLSNFVPILPLIIPVIASVIGYVVLLSPNAGLINIWIRDLVGIVGIDIEEGPLDIFSRSGLIFLYTVLVVPFAYLPIASAFRNLDPSYEEASRSAGAGLFTTLRKVTIPAIKPAVTTAVMLSMVVTFAIFAIPAVIAPTAGANILSLRVYDALRAFPPETDVAVALNSVVLALVGIGYAVQRRSNRNSQFATVSGRANMGRRIALGRAKWPLRLVIMSYLAFTSIVPFVALVLLSVQPFWIPDFRIIHGTDLDSYRDVFFEYEPAQDAMMRSGMIGVVGATMSTIVIAIVVLHVRRSGTRLAGVIDGLTKLPGTLSRLIIASAFALAFSGGPVKLQGTLTIVLLANFVFYLPFGSFVVGAAAAQIGRDVTEASAVCNATRWQTFRFVELPLIKPALLAAWALMFIQMTGDVIGAAMLGGPGTTVIGTYVLQQWEAGSFTQVAAISVVITLVSSTLILVVQALGRVRVRPSV